MRHLLPFAFIAIALVGCGGSGGGSSVVTPVPETPTEKGTALFNVDVNTGKVTVVPLEGADSRAKSSVLGGNAVSFTTSTLLSEGGEVGRRVVKVQMKNNLSEPIGVERPIRLQFGVFSPLSAYPTDLRDQATVSTLVRDLTPGFLDGPAGTARFSNPTAVTVGADGAIYFNGTDNRIRRLLDGYISTVAQNVAASGFTYLKDPLSNREYIVAASSATHSIKLIPVASGSVTTWAGLDNTPGNVNGAAASARFNSPYGVAVDAQSAQVLVADSGNGAVRAIPFTFVGGNLVAGTVLTRYSGLTAPYCVAVASNRTVGVTEGNVNRVRLYNAGSSREAIIGTGTAGNIVGDGNITQFSLPVGITALGETFFVTDVNNFQIKRIALKNGAAPLLAANWTTSLVAGMAASGTTDGSGTVAQFGSIPGLTADPQNRLVVSDQTGNSIRRIVSNGAFDFGTPTGSGVGGTALVNLTGVADLDGLHRPFIDVNKTVQPGETVDAGDWQFSIPDGVSAFRFAVTVEAATPYFGGLEAVLNPTGGPGSPNVIAQILNRPSGSPIYTGRLENIVFGSSSSNLAYDGAGNLYSSDDVLRMVRRITPSGNVTLIAGRPNEIGTANGVGSQARFSQPAGILVNKEGSEIILADPTSNTIRRVALAPGADPTNADNWVVSTIAGLAGIAGGTNGSGDVARFSYPWGLAGYDNDAVFISETSGNRIRILTYVGGNRALATSWSVSPACGSTAGSSGFLDGTSGSARFSGPYGISLTKAGLLYIADYSNSRIRVLDTKTMLVSTAAGNGTPSDNDNIAANLGGVTTPIGLVADESGAVYFSRTGVVRRILNGTLKTVAGNGDGSGRSGDKLQFGECWGLATNRQGDLTFVSNGRLIRLTRKLGL
jgi:hypothetical protein